MGGMVIIRSVPSRSRKKRAGNSSSFQVPTAGHDTVLRIPDVVSIHVPIFYCMFGYNLLRPNHVQNKLDQLSKSSWTRNKSSH